MKKQNKKVQIQIPKPCHADSSNMTAVQGGKFCHQCDKYVVDFTTWTDAQLIDYFKQQKGRTCGTFRTDQLARDLQLPASPSKLQQWKVAAALSAGLMTSQVVPAQSQSFHTDTAIENYIQRPLVDGEVLPPTNRQLQGQVVDETTGDALIGAHIRVQHTQFITVADIDGQFSLAIPDSIEHPTLEVSYTGYETVYLTNLDFVVEQQIEMKPGAVLNEIEVIGYRVPLIEGAAYYAGDYTIENEQRESNLSEKTQWKDLEIPTSPIYPNPFHEQFTIQLDIETAAVHLINLYDLNGQLRYATTVDLATGKQHLTLEQLPSTLASGQYILQVVQGNKVMLTEKVIKTITNQ